MYARRVKFYAHKGGRVDRVRAFPPGMGKSGPCQNKIKGLLVTAKRNDNVERQPIRTPATIVQAQRPRHPARRLLKSQRRTPGTNRDTLQKKKDRSAEVYRAAAGKGQRRRVEPTPWAGKRLRVVLAEKEVFILVEKGGKFPRGFQLYGRDKRCRPTLMKSSPKKSS